MTEQGKGLRSLTLANLLTHDFPTREALIAPWLKQGESALLYAPPGLGKSMLALSLALVAAGGGRLLDWEAPTPRRVLYVDGEMHADDIQSRAALLMKTVGGLDLQAAGRNLTMLPRQYQAPEVAFPDLADQKGRESFLDMARRGVPESPGMFDLVILDNLSTLATNLDDENAAESFNDVVSLLMVLKQAGVACILVHHSNKTGGSYRGSSKLATTFEVIMQLSRLTNTKSRYSTAFTLGWEKYRHRRDARTTGKDVRLVVEEGGAPRWEHEASAAEEAAHLVELVRSGEFAFDKELAAALKVSPATLSRRRAKAVELGLIKEVEWKERLDQARTERLADPIHAFTAHAFDSAEAAQTDF